MGLIGPRSHCTPLCLTTPCRIKEKTAVSVGAERNSRSEPSTLIHEPVIGALPPTLCDRMREEECPARPSTWDVLSRRRNHLPADDLQQQQPLQQQRRRRQQQQQRLMMMIVVVVTARENPCQLGRAPIKNGSQLSCVLCVYSASVDNLDQPDTKKGFVTASLCNAERCAWGARSVSYQSDELPGARVVDG
ncbi:unnamed protein product [Lampetra fluviatilis]